MTTATEVLIEEHNVITAAIEEARSMLQALTQDMQSMDEALKWVNFFRHYADGYHHFKEEQILFPELCRRNEMLAMGIVAEMLDNHSDFREMLSTLESHIQKSEHANALKTFELYAEALLNHIAVENDELFQIADSLLDSDELETMARRFTDCDNELGATAKAEFEALV